MEWFTKRENIKLVTLALLLWTVLVIWYALLHHERGLFTVAFLNVGQGDAIFVESPSGNQMLVDAGRSARVLRELGAHMPFYDREIDLVVATHPDQDHIGGIPDVLARYRVPLVMRSGAVNDTGVFRELNRLVAAGRVEEVIAQRGMLIDFGDGVYAEVLFPDRDMSRSDPNNASVIMRLVYGEHEFMLTGDAPQSVEKYILGLDVQSGRGLSSDVLKAGHHGSDTSSSEFFIAAVDPEYAVVSAGRDNRYGHPHEEVLARFADLGVPVLATAEGDSIVFTSDGTLLKRH